MVHFIPTGATPRTLSAGTRVVEQSVVLVLLMFKHGVVGGDCCL
jgi:hypothetical protein